MQRLSCFGTVLVQIRTAIQGRWSVVLCDSIRTPRPASPEWLVHKAEKRRDGTTRRDRPCFISSANPRDLGSRDLHREAVTFEVQYLRREVSKCPMGHTEAVTSLSASTVCPMRRRPGRIVA